jgi:hypothetical protein
MYIDYRGFTLIKTWSNTYAIYDGAKYIMTTPTLRAAKEAVCKITNLVYA